MKTINIKDFSEHPGLRHCSVSDDSGEEFYHKILNKAERACVAKGGRVVLNA